MSPSEKAIIFCGKKARADDLSSEMSLKGIPVQCIHGDRDQVRNNTPSVNFFLLFKILLTFYLIER